MEDLARPSCSVANDYFALPVIVDSIDLCMSRQNSVLRCGTAIVLECRRSIEKADLIASAIGNGLYGVDFKQVGDDFVVIEANDTLANVAGAADQKTPSSLHDCCATWLRSGVSHG
jgi:hypothetical protein